MPSSATAAPLVWDGTGDAPPAARGAVVAIGNFDGVHRGHKALLGQARALAARLGRPLAVLTFEPHPRSYFQLDRPVFRLSEAAVRRALLAREGVSAVVEWPFDESLASMGADAFIDDILLGRLDAAGVAVGGDFRFGTKRSGDVALLRDRLARPGRQVLAVDAVTDAEGLPVSSSRVRAALEAGDVAGANALLGHAWIIRAEVRHGDKRGRELGYPTANMILPPDCRLRHGIYAVAIRIDGAWRPGAASFGRRPTFDDGAPRLETFVFDFSGDLYGRTLDVVFSAWIRGEERFDSIAALTARMAADCDVARKVRHEPPFD